MELTEVAKLRRSVLRSISEYTWNDCLPDRVYDIIYTLVTEDTQRYRCCVHKERAVLKNRIQMALGTELRLNIIDAANKVLKEGQDKTLPIIDVLPDACDQCPIEKYYVTDMCRHCISHKCINNCPKKCITIHQDRAFIDRTACIECGKCKQSCPFGAIIEISRPCVRACALDALHVGENKKSIVDYDKCVQCGNCRAACPFGAIDERSSIVPIILALKSKKPIIAMLAPSFVGQFGMKITPEQIVNGLKELGFTAVVEVAVGADLTAIHEAEEFIHKVPKEQEFMTNSCCPAFVNLIKKHHPDQLDKVSTTVSPMVACGRYIKDKMDNPLTVFIGPCIAKKIEVRDHPEAVDFAMTFEELQCVFEGVGIDLTKEVTQGFDYQASKGGVSFPLNKGVQTAVKDILDKKGVSVEAVYAAGLERCDDTIKEILAGKVKCNYMEGMACSGGCIAGPGALVDQGLTRVMVTKFLENAPYKDSDDNPEMIKIAESLNLEQKN